MLPPKVPPNEDERLETLQSLAILDTAAEAGFDALVDLAASIAGTPISLVSLVDADRQWFKARHGLDAAETPRDVSFCGHVVADDAALVVPDAFEDPRFSDNPLVRGAPFVRFYAGMPIRMPNGAVLGTVCVIDHVPRQLTEEQIRLLKLLAQQTVDQLTLRRTNLELETYHNFFVSSLHPLCTATADHHFDALNPAWQTVLGWSPEQLRARPFTSLVHPDDLQDTLSFTEQLNSTGIAPANFTNRYRHKNGDWVPLSWVAAKSNGVFYMTATDMTEYEATQSHLQQLVNASRHLASVVETSDDAILTKTIDGTITSWNQGAEKIFGFTEAEAMGQPITIIFPPDRISEEREVMDKLRRGERIDHFETVRMRKDRSFVEVSASISPLHNDDGEVMGASKILRDITEKNRLQRLKNEFVSTVSHELRTPLTSIRGSLGLIAAGITGVLEPETQEYVDIALSNTNRLVRLINDILDIEGMTSGQMNFQLKSVSLHKAVSDALGANRGIASSHGVGLELATDVPAGEILVDEDRLAQVFANLISNAAKFSPGGRPVSLSVRTEGDGVRIGVRDHGPGIPESFKRHIFNRFAQADGSSTRKQGGSGLGLAITKAIISRLGGSISFVDAPGGGTEFFFYLPKLYATNPSVVPSGRQRVLVCEDDPQISALIQSQLESHGYEVDVAPTVELSKRLLESRSYDAITLDLILADGDGTSLIDFMRVDLQSDLPILVVSETPELATGLNVSDTIAKPFDPKFLVASLAKAIGYSGRGANVLHVEDDADLVHVVSRSLTDGLNVTSATTLSAAKAFLSSQDFDVVILDLALPDGDGEDLIPFVGRAQVVLYSAHDPSSDVAARVSATLIKTRASPIELAHVIDRLLQSPPGTRS
jgi:PAS domain S-box-containing protein